MGQLILSMPVTIAAGIAPKARIRAHPPPAAPPYAASKPGSFGAGSTLQTHNAAKLNNAGSVVLNPDSAIPRLLSVCTGRAKVQLAGTIPRGAYLETCAGPLPAHIQDGNGLSSPPRWGRFFLKRPDARSCPDDTRRA